MPTDRDQMTPDDPEDAERLRNQRGQGTGGTGLDALPSEQDDALGEAAAVEGVDADEPGEPASS